MSAFFDLVREMPPPFNMIVLVVAIGSAAGVVKALVKQLRVYADNDADRRLKRDLVDSGLTVPEVERIAAAKVTRDLDPACNLDPACK
ncbi:hypothetical protein Pla108_15790 [Botrimarina colliarenosi]|uniref:Uncharacterized protein n=1 Tax=Botrimarina colliarenosi TaxID=2528001 RepID=A0A5C6AMC4_9BACT|nr:hypothetical protein [Botrimarina colliarenosi]TWU00627.1 hypothetical protein Pla108_15790 [Botrimarina colliarenosi]